MSPIAGSTVFIWLVLLAPVFAVRNAPAAEATGPTLARLCFWVPPERMGEFAQVYRREVAPLLRRHGFDESAQPGRATVDSVFSRLFPLANPDEFLPKVQALRSDPDVGTLLHRLAERFGRDETSSRPWYFFGMYQRPLGPGRTGPAGMGKGHWRSYDASDGLFSGSLHSLLQDRDGYLWFTTDGGVFRYDGRTSLSFTKRDGLASNWASAALEDRDGRLWFGTLGGVRCFDGRTFATYTTINGLGGNVVERIFQDRDGILWFGTDAGVSRYDGQSFVTFTTANGLAGNYVSSIFQDREGTLWFGTERGVSRYDGHGFTNLTAQQGLPLAWVADIGQDHTGRLWFCTWGEGVAAYDGRHFQYYRKSQGLPSDRVLTFLQDQEGVLWFGTDSGASRFDGRQFTTFTTQNGLPGNAVNDILQDRNGAIWFATNAGASRYDSRTTTTYTTQDGLPSNEVSAVIQDRSGRIWIGFRSGEITSFDGQTFTSYDARDGLGGYGYNAFPWILEDQRGDIWFRSEDLLGQLQAVRLRGGQTEVFTLADGLPRDFSTGTQERDGAIWFGGAGELSRYDGERFIRHGAAQGVPPSQITSMAQDQQGNLWLATWDGGVCRYDGSQFTPFTTNQGLASDDVWGALADRLGNLWFGTYGGGLSRYDGKDFTTFSTQDGLPSPFLMPAALKDRVGGLWFGTDGGGVIRCDGRVFQTFNTHDGLAGNVVRSILEDREGNLWFGCSGGLTRYRAPKPALPPVVLDAVVADRRYQPQSQLAFPSGIGLVGFEFHGLSLKTRPGGLVYRYRLAGYDPNWRTTAATRVEYQDLPRGSYTFEVQAVDRDLGYSPEPARVEVEIHLPYNRVILWGLLGTTLAGLVVVAMVAGRRRQERDQARETLVQQLEQELKTAHDLQMGLMPAQPPRLAGLDIAGRCLPANHVGGDFFQFFHREETLSLCLADVTGHAMDAAIPAVMFSGMLETQMEGRTTLEVLFGRLNHSLCRVLGKRTFVCFAMAELHLSSRRLRVANSGCPYPYHFERATGAVSEIQVEAYPLGIRPDTHHPVREVQLEAGDWVVFCSDGVIEAVNVAGEMFGFERTVEVVRRGCQEGLSAEGLLERVMQEVKQFRGEVAQGDDQTVVVLRVEE